MYYEVKEARTLFETIDHHWEMYSRVNRSIVLYLDRF